MPAGQGYGKGKRGQKTKSKKQVAYLMSKGSPLTAGQRNRLAGELRSGKVRVRG